MNKAEFLKQAKRAAAILKRNKRDPRYIKTIGLLVTKGFLYANREILRMPNVRVNVEDAIWAGKNVEPRILEVLPAAVIRMENRFNYNPDKHVELKKAIELLEQGEDGEFFDIPLEKIRPWLNIRLKDGRVKAFDKKKVMKTFRFSPETIERINALKEVMNASETEILEQLVANNSTLGSHSKSQIEK